jgi:hypothetical protein
MINSNLLPNQVLEIHFMILYPRGQKIIENHFMILYPRGQKIIEIHFMILYPRGQKIIVPIHRLKLVLVANQRQIVASSIQYLLPMNNPRICNSPDISLVPITVSIYHISNESCK